MSASPGAGYRPQTRWCLPHPYAAQGAQAPAAVPPPAAVRGRQAAPTSAEVLLAQLQRDLERGYWRVALRRFLMLEACGGEVPAPQRRHCLELARACASGPWRKMQADVAAWARCFREVRCGRGAP